MKKLYFIILLLLFISDAVAQECIERKNKLGFNLYFNEFDFNSFEKKFGVKYWLFNKTALRSTLGFSKGQTISEYLDQLIDEDSIDFSLYLEYHFYNNKRISPYLGFGAELAVSNVYNDNLSPQLRNRKIYHKDSQRISSNIPLGIECELFRYLSLAMQYNIYFTIKKLNEKTETQFPDGVIAWNYTEVNTKSFSSNKFYVILSFYH